jgi:hypothetical protein
MNAEAQRETQREIPALVQSKLNFILVASFPALLPLRLRASAFISFFCRKPGVFRWMHMDSRL